VDSEAAGELEEAPPGTWVFRGGDLPRASSLKNLRRVHEAYPEIWGVCVTASPGKDHDAAAQDVRFGTREMCRSLSEEIAEKGWKVVREPGKDWPCGLLTFPNGEPDSEEWDRLRTHMIERGMIPNPRYKGK
jgi:hypothetical protein